MMKRPVSEGGTPDRSEKGVQSAARKPITTVNFEGRWLSVGRDDEAKVIVRH